VRNGCFARGSDPGQHNKIIDSTTELKGLSRRTVTTCRARREFMWTLAIRKPMLFVISFLSTNRVVGPRRQVKTAAPSSRAIASFSRAGRLRPI
jgi:hypothetical protein